MTISITTVRMNYTGTGSVSTYPYNFQIDDESHLEVRKTDSNDENGATLVLNTDYTVTGVGEASGGNVVLTTDLEAGYNLAITRVSPRTQTLDLVQRGAFNPETIETRFDKHAMLIQELTDDVSRSIKLTRTSGAEGDEVTQALADSVAQDAQDASDAADRAETAAASVGVVAFTNKSAVSAGVTIATISLQDNSSVFFELFADGLKASSIGSIASWTFYLHRKTGVTEINELIGREALGGDFQDGSFTMEQSGNDAVLKLHVASGTWVASGSISYKAAKTPTITLA